MGVVPALPWKGKLKRGSNAVLYSRLVVAIKTRWLIKEPKGVLVQELSKSLKLSPITCHLLTQRGIKSIEEAQAFLNPSLKNLPDPFLFKDMDKAAARVEQAVFNNEPICIYGDYDVDGTTGASILTQFFRDIKADVFFYIPHRMTEGYGISENVIKVLKEKSAKLVITCDCGTANQDEVALIQKEGVDVIVTDHHKIQAKHPPAFAFLNHQRTDCQYPEKTLSGVGVAFNLIMASRFQLRRAGYFKKVQEPDLKNYLDLVALGTLSDMVPLHGGNRVLVVNGLKAMNPARRIGLKALIECARLQNREVTTQGVAFGLAPRINAGGRIDTARVIVELFTTEDEARAKELAESLEQKNQERRVIQDKIYKEALAFVEQQLEVSSPPSSTDVQGWVSPHAIVVGSSGWHAGVIGIVASKLVEKYYRPAIVIAFSEGIGKGSCRSIEGFDVTHALSHAKKYLVQFGGHAAAAGLSVKEENFLKFAKAFDAHVQKTIQEEDFTPKLYLDLETDLETVTEELVRELKYLEPYGAANPEPVFSSRDLKVSRSKVVGGKHLKLFVRGKKEVREAIAFNRAEIIKELSPSLSLAYVPELNEWRGITTVQLRVKDLIC